MKRTAALLAFVAALASLPAHADDASHRAKAREMINIIHVERVVPQIVAGMTNQATNISRQLLGPSPTPEQQLKANAFQQKVTAAVQAQINWTAMEPAYIDLYTTTFTEAELDGILAFYKTPAGIAMVEKLPTLSGQAQQLGQQKIAALQPQLSVILEDFKKQVAATPAPAAKPQ